MSFLRLRFRLWPRAVVLCPGTPTPSSRRVGNAGSVVVVVVRCGKCQRYLKYIAARPQRMYCAHCNQTYSLPQGGSVKLYKEIKCPLDDFELVIFSSPTKVCSIPFFRVVMFSFLFSHVVMFSFLFSRVPILPCSHTWCVHIATTSLLSKAWRKAWAVIDVHTSRVHMRYHNRGWISVWNVTTEPWSWNHTSRQEARHPNGRYPATVQSNCLPWIIDDECVCVCVCVQVQDDVRGVCWLF